MPLTDHNSVGSRIGTLEHNASKLPIRRQPLAAPPIACACTSTTGNTLPQTPPNALRPTTATCTRTLSSNTVTRVPDAFTDNWISVALVQLGPDAEDVALGTELTATTEEGDADVGTDDVAGMGNDDDVPGDEGAEDVELAPTAPPEP